MTSKQQQLACIDEDFRAASDKLKRGHLRWVRLVPHNVGWLTTECSARPAKLTPVNAGDHIDVFDLLNLDLMELLLDELTLSDASALACTNRALATTMRGLLRSERTSRHQALMLPAPRQRALMFNGLRAALSQTQPCFVLYDVSRLIHTKKAKKSKSAAAQFLLLAWTPYAPSVAGPEHDAMDTAVTTMKRSTTQGLAGRIGLQLRTGIVRREGPIALAKACTEDDLRELCVAVIDGSGLRAKSSSATKSKVSHTRGELWRCDFFDSLHNFWRFPFMRHNPLLAGGRGATDTQNLLVVPND